MKRHHTHPFRVHPKPGFREMARQCFGLSYYVMEIDSFVPRQQIDQRASSTLPCYVVPNETIAQAALR